MPQALLLLGRGIIKISMAAVCVAATKELSISGTKEMKDGASQTKNIVKNKLK